MTLSTMSIDEAIALACREVPECAPGNEEIDLHGVPGERDSVYLRPDHGRVYHALWFYSATIWFLTESERVADLRRSGQPTFNLRKGKDGLWYISPSVGVNWFPRQGPFPSEFHALVSACLLVARKPVP